MTEIKEPYRHEYPYNVIYPRTLVGRLIMWINLPVSTLLCYFSFLKGVIPWPGLIEERIPSNPLWPSLWWLFSGFVLVHVAERWETRCSQSEQGGITEIKEPYRHEYPYTLIYPKTVIARLQFWINLPLSTIFFWVSWMNGVIPWPNIIQERLPKNPLWPSMWFYFSLFVLSFAAERWETRCFGAPQNKTTEGKELSLREDLYYLFDPQTKLSRFLMWINLPLSTMFCWISWMNGVIPWPTIIQRHIPSNPLWPSIWWFISLFILVFVAERWEVWYSDSRRNRSYTPEHAGLKDASSVAQAAHEKRSVVKSGFGDACDW